MLLQTVMRLVMLLAKAGGGANGSERRRFVQAVEFEYPTYTVAKSRIVTMLLVEGLALQLIRTQTNHHHPPPKEVAQSKKEEKGKNE
eukprot:4362595-Amphidinium_carterae.1